MDKFNADAGYTMTLVVTTTTRDKIVELAQEAIASRGYSAFSFRELAAALGIKSASIHYHFPTKGHLGAEVAKNYRERLTDALELIEEQCSDPKEAVERLIAIYRHEAITSQRMTVCIMLAAEIKNIPYEIQSEMASFYRLNISWLKLQFCKAGYSDEIANEKACQFFALLQGALIGAKGQGNSDYFEIVVKAKEVFF